MPLLLDTALPGSAAALEVRNANVLTIGLINNMPDAALEATERQFVELIRAAAGSRVVCLKLFAMADVPRSDVARRQLSERYRDVSTLWDAPLDGLIVTGTEPRAPNLRDEPYWATLAKVIDWAAENTVSAVWSCLAAHAAVLHTDGIERQRFAEKLFGVFPCDALAAHPLMNGSARQLPIPHSRYNDLPEPALVAAGYEVLTRSPAAGVDMFVSQAQRFPSLFVLMQGHPEYEAVTLLREYRRDVARFLRGERDRYPAPPQGYFGNAAAEQVTAFRARALGERREDLMADFPMAALERTLKCAWHGAAAGIYANWLAYLQERSAAARTRAVPGRRLQRGA
jgi:homoserine O-succinyltransferase